MIQTRIINEINQSYFEITEYDSTISDDYRLRMLEENKLPCFLQKTVRCIDGVAKDYYEITGKESLVSFFNLRAADRNELSRLFKAMADVSDEAEKLLIEEGNILFRPDCIFVDSRTMNYEFICIPINDYDVVFPENIKSLLQSILPKLDDNDIDLLKTVYSMFDRAQSEGITCKILYDLFQDGINKNQNNAVIVPRFSGKSVEDNEEKEPDSPIRFVPSPKGIAAIVCAVTGIFLIGYHTYLIMLSNL